jgi:signal transduction histidine kinase/CheY-like chemotaxis protein
MLNQNHPFVQTEIKLTRKDGSQLHALLSSALLHPEEENSDFVVTIMDMTERHHLEQQLIQQQKLESIGMLAGGMAHDINNLLTPILISVEMVSRKIPSDHPAKPRLGTIQGAAVKIKDLVAQVLLFSRKQHSELQPLDLNSVVSNFMGMLRRTIRENVTMDIKTSLEPCSVLADSTQLEQILMNLAVNAQDAIDGAGQITVETGHLVLDSEYCACNPSVTPGRYVMLAFTDSGCGIDEETRLKVFEPFFTTKPEGKGTGLGLSTVYGIVRQHGGHLDVFSTIGCGPTIRIFLPMQHASPEIIFEEKYGESSQVGIFTGTLLLVEDNTMLRESIHEVLIEHGIHVIAADSPHEALRIFKEHGDEISFILTDIIMPEMNGPELYRQLQGLRPDLHVLFMSGYASDASNPAIFLPKPFTIQNLMSKLSAMTHSDNLIITQKESATLQEIDGK